MHLITFATPSHIAHANNLVKSALAHGFTTSRVYTPEDLSPEFIRANAALFMAHRAGYWVWKPWIILDYMCSQPTGQIVCYSDSMYLVKGSMEPLVTAWLADSACDIAITHNKPNEPSFPECAWSKADAFAQLQMTMDDATPQAWAGFLVMRVSPASIDFVRRWLGLAQTDLITDAPSRLPNHPSFKENRHDQTVLSLLAKREGIPFHTFPPSPLYNLRVPPHI